MTGGIASSGLDQAPVGGAESRKAVSVTVGVIRPPVLTRRGVAARLRDSRPDWPLELTRAAAEEIILALAETLAEGRTVALNGFGRFEVRRYPGARKKVGLIFRPGARLKARLQPPETDSGRQGRQ